MKFPLSNLVLLFFLCWLNFVKPTHHTKWNGTHKSMVQRCSLLWIRCLCVCLCEQWVEKWRKWKEKSISTNCGGQWYTSTQVHMHTHSIYNHHTNDARTRVKSRFDSARVCVCVNMGIARCSTATCYTGHFTVPWSMKSLGGCCIPVKRIHL